jgi:hypothetical protein
MGHLVPFNFDFRPRQRRKSTTFSTSSKTNLVICIMSDSINVLNVPVTGLRDMAQEDLEAARVPHEMAAASPFRCSTPSGRQPLRTMMVFLTISSRTRSDPVLMAPQDRHLIGSYVNRELISESLTLLQYYNQD